MLNKKPSTVISSYKRRQRTGPFIIWGIVAVLVLAGLIISLIWLFGQNGPAQTFFATATPTPTMTFTPTVTPTLTDTPTDTPVPTETLTPTASAPFEYSVEDGDTLTSIVQKFNLGNDGIPLILFLNPYDSNTGNGIDPSTLIISVGQKITIPNPGMPLPTDTPFPTGMPVGTKVTYTVKAGDTLASIASKFNSTVDDILKQNNLTDSNTIYVSQQLVVRVNLVTPTPTKPPTITPGPSVTPSSPFTATPVGANPVPTDTPSS